MIGILDALITQSRSWGVREIAEHVGTSRSSAHRTLVGLVEINYAQQDDRAQYRLGPRLRVIARAMQRNHPLFVTAQSQLAALRDQEGATAFLTLAGRADTSGTVLVVREPDTFLRFSIRPGHLLALHADPVGTAIRAIRDPGTGPDIEEARARGAAVSVGGHAPDVAALAVGIALGPDLTAAVSIARPIDAETPAPIEAGLEHASSVAQELQTSMRAARDAAVEPGPRESTPASTFVQRVDRLITRLARTPVTRASSRSLARAIGAGPAATASLVDAGQRLGLLAEENEDLLSAGSLLLRWAAILGAEVRDEDLVADELASLAAIVGETVGFIAFDGRRARLVRNAPGQGFVRYVPVLETDVPLHAGASGKAILAQVPELVDALPKRRLTERTIAGREELLRELAEIRRRGWAIGEGERYPEAFGIAAPYFVDGAVAGSVTVTMPRRRVDRSAVESIGQAVSATTGRITALLTTTP